MTTSTGIELQELPKEKEFEEFISAYFQCAGYYIEQNIIDRKVAEVLELDIIITDYDKNPPKIILVEVKSGGWGFADIFKIRGWMDYTNIPEGLLVASGEKENIDFIKEVANPLYTDAITIPDLTKTQEYLSDYIEIQEVDGKDIEIWRFSYWVLRSLLNKLNQKKKSVHDKKCYEVLYNYFFTVNSGIFFTQNIVQKLDKLFELFKQNPKLSAKTANELKGNNFYEEVDNIDSEIFEDTFYSCKYNDIQISTFIEHSARITILKNAVDYCLYKKAGDTDRTNDKIIKILGFEISTLQSLPEGFLSGLEELAEHEYVHLYPTFWQWYLWVFGGFILKDIEEREYELLFKKTGVPVEEIPNAFKAYELLFPREGGWFQVISNTNTEILKLFPIPFRGIGANFRRFHYAESQNFEELKPLLSSGVYAYNDLINWNNCTVKVLS